MEPCIPSHDSAAHAGWIIDTYASLSYGYSRFARRREGFSRPKPYLPPPTSPNGTGRVRKKRKIVSPLPNAQHDRIAPIIERAWEKLRQQWISRGCCWFSVPSPPPVAQRHHPDAFSPPSSTIVSSECERVVLENGQEYVMPIRSSYFQVTQFSCRSHLLILRSISLTLMCSHPCCLNHLPSH